MEALEPAIETIAKKGIKLAANAGTVATKELFELVVKMVKDKGLTLSVAWIEGDVVLEQVQTAMNDGTCEFVNFCTGQNLKDWQFKPIFAQCYLGGMGIAKAFENGADIVICGRVADASPIIGATAWWHGWSSEDFDLLAKALMAGHLIECSAYVTGGNFTGFKALDFQESAYLGFPFAEIAHDGDVVITKQQNTGGLVTVETCKEQLLYEIQGQYYYNSDVTAVIKDAKFTQLSENRVRLSGIQGLPPPPHTKVGLTAFGGYRAELHWCALGLDIKEKAELLEIQLRASLGESRIKKFTTFSLTVNGSSPENPRNQTSAVVDLKLTCQAMEKDDLSLRNFVRPCLDTIM